MFRDPHVSFGFDRPSNCLGLRSFIVHGWNFRSGPIWNLGIRVLGVTVDVSWHFMSEDDEEQWRLFREYDEEEEIEEMEE